MREKFFLKTFYLVNEMFTKSIYNGLKKGGADCA